MDVVSVIAAKVVQEAKKTKISWALCLVIIALLITFPFALKSDGSLKGQIQLTLKYSLIVTAISMYFISLFFAAISFSREIKFKQIYLLECKPVHRSQFFLGKFLGIALLNFIYLLIIGIVVFLMIFYLKNYTGTKVEQQEVDEQIFIAYREIQPTVPLKKINDLVNRGFERLKQENRLPAKYKEFQIKNELRKKILHTRQLVPYGARPRIWTFKNIPFIEEGKKLKLKYKFFASKFSFDLLCKIRWIIGEGHNTYAKDFKIQSGKVAEFTIPSYVVNNNKVVIRFYNFSNKSGLIYFPLNDGIKLYYPSESFYVNYIKGFILIYCLSCFLVMLSLTACTFLSFPVAIFLGLVVLFIGVIANFFVELQLFPKVDENFFQSITHTISRVMVKISIFMVPDFAYYVPIDKLCTGEIIEWETFWENVAKLLVLRTFFLAVLGIFIFNRKEIGKPAIH